MAQIVIRAFEPRDDVGFRHVRAMVYREGDAVPTTDRLLRDDCLAYVGELDGEIVAAATTLDMTCTKGKGAMRCAGIAAVGVVPERRRSGIGGALMSEAIPLMRAEGFAIASLYAFRSTYYRKFGYEHAGSRIEIKCSSDRLPRIATDLDPRQIMNQGEIRGCYESFAQRYAGMNLRKKDDQWWRVLGADRPLQIYAFGDPIEGYVVLRLNSGFWEEQHVKELVWTSPRAYEAILAFLKSLSMNKTAVVWSEPGDSPFRARFLDQGISFNFAGPIMYRIVDVKTAVELVSSEETGEFAFQVQDPQVVENRGPWRVCYGPEGTMIERGGNPAFEVSIGTLTQAVLGEPSFAQLLRAGSIRVTRDIDTEKAARFFGFQSTFCMDFF